MPSTPANGPEDRLDDETASMDELPAAPADRGDSMEQGTCEGDLEALCESDRAEYRKLFLIGC
ncbi:hypothetical protein [Candidatus Rariloculus sp.]|uniref:hypothetical protein n=1 Tax=Candidatus Rariloculus sp. TaxID=3101265 RepID=UPI003D112DA6